MEWRAVLSHRPEEPVLDLSKPNPLGFAIYPFLMREWAEGLKLSI